MKSNIGTINLKVYERLATEEDILELLQVYNEYFQPVEDDVRLHITDSSDPVIHLDDIVTSDLGSEVEAKMSYSDLAGNLGFTHHTLPHQFNHLRHQTGITAWEEPQVFEASGTGSQCLVPLKLHWHQLSGVHSIIRRSFTSAPTPSHCTGTLECDEVGLGKTTLALTVVAFLNQAVALQKKNAPLPPILGQSLSRFVCRVGLIIYFRPTFISPRKEYPQTYASFDHCSRDTDYSVDPRASYPVSAKQYRHPFL